MDRRAWLGALAGTLGAALASGSAPGQTAVQSPGQVRPQKGPPAADPLQNPDWVGRPRSPVTSADNDAGINAAERKLRCTCGCGLDVFTCRTTDFSCSYSPALHREAIAFAAEGKSPDEVVAAFVAKYGESILMAPKAQGFGALGYILPGTALAIAAVLLAWVLLRRNERRPAVVAAAPPTGPAANVDDITPEDAARLEEALKSIER